jgi:hypothetical protein
MCRVVFDVRHDVASFDSFRNDGKDPVTASIRVPNAEDTLNMRMS